MASRIHRRYGTTNEDGLINCRYGWHTTEPHAARSIAGMSPLSLPSLPLTNVASAVRLIILVKSGWLAGAALFFSAVNFRCIHLRTLPIMYYHVVTRGRW